MRMHRDLEKEKEKKKDMAESMEWISVINIHNPTCQPIWTNLSYYPEYATKINAKYRIIEQNKPNPQYLTNNIHKRKKKKDARDQIAF